MCHTLLLTGLPSFNVCLPADCAVAVWILCKHGAFTFTSESVNEEDLYTSHSQDDESELGAGLAGAEHPHKD